MLRTVGFAAAASLPLLAGAAAGVLWKPPRRLLAVVLAFAAGALIAALAFELFEGSYQDGGALPSGLAFGAGALVFVVADSLLDRFSSAGVAGPALLAGVTLDGIPENTALGVSLSAGGGSLALLMAVFVSNFPEALSGAAAMRDKGSSRRAVLALWAGATVLLAVSVLVGSRIFAGASPEQVALPLAFAAGAVLASVVDTLAPKAFADGGAPVALASAMGFFAAFLLSH
jgi:ZIP family zinc transporter